MRKLKFKTLFVLLLLCVITHAQETIKVTGKVIDNNKMPLVGVNVFDQDNPHVGVITDMDGKYQIQVKDNAILVFSFIGFEKQTINVNAQTTIDVKMVDNAIGLDEVIAVGYGNTTKRKMTSSVTNVNKDALKNTSATTLTEAMAGKVAGVIIQKKGGNPNDLPTISIRGGQAPLYIIDGVPSTAFEFASINPDDIQDFSILKDAAASAVYGARAANGIVLVTTKRGEAGKLKVDYSVRFDASKPTVEPEIMSPLEYAEYQNAVGLNTSGQIQYTDEQLQQIATGSNPELFPNTDWYGLLIKDYANTQQHNLSLSGGSDKLNGYVSLGYQDVGSQVKTDNYENKKFTYRSNLSAYFEEVGLTVSLDLNGIMHKVQDLPFGGINGIFHGALRSPLRHGLVLDGSGRFANEVGNPLAKAGDGAGYNRRNQSINKTKLSFQWAVPFVEGLTLSGFGNHRRLHDARKNWNAYAPVYDPFTLEEKSLSQTNLSQSYATNDTYDYEARINYIKAINNHNLDLTFAYTQMEYDHEWFNAYRTGFISNNIDYLFAGSSDGKNNNGSASQDARKGYVGKLIYDYKGKYILDANFRYDASIRFPEEERWGFFPSVSLGWNMTEELFMSSLVDNNILDYLKVRASYGVVGNDGGSNVSVLGYVPVYALVQNTYVVDGKNVTGYKEGDLVSNAITWYEQESYNFGFDFTTLKNKLSGSFDYFYQRTTGYPTSPKTRYTTPLGKPLPLVSSNSSHRKAGWDAQLTYKDNIGDLKFNIAGNITVYDQLWEKNDNESETDLMNPYRRITHATDYHSVAYTADGYYQNYNEIMNSPRFLAANALRPGDIRYIDSNGDGKIDAQDGRKVGNSYFPHVYYGFNIDADYKGFNLNATIEGAGTRTAQAAYALDYEIYKYRMDYWTPENRNAEFPRPTGVSSINGGNNTAHSTHWLYDIQFIRLKNITLSYDLKRTLLKNVNGLSRCSIYLSGANLITFADKFDVMDPQTIAVNNRAYPVQKVYSIGLKVGL